MTFLCEKRGKETASGGADLGKRSNLNAYNLKRRQEHEAGGLGTRCQRHRNTRLAAWEHDAGGLGTRC